MQQFGLWTKPNIRANYYCQSSSILCHFGEKISAKYQINFNLLPIKNANIVIG